MTSRDFKKDDLVLFIVSIPSFAPFSSAAPMFQGLFKDLCFLICIQVNDAHVTSLMEVFAQFFRLPLLSYPAGLAFLRLFYFAL